MIFLRSLFVALLTAVFSLTSHAADFAIMKSFGDGAIWSVKPPKTAKGVTLRVFYSADDVNKESFVDACDFEGFSDIKYPFDERLIDGVYSWELSLINDGLGKGYTGKPEGAIDKNGREIAIVGQPKDTFKRTYISNSGRGSVQTGSFRVIDGVIAELDLKEEQDKSKQ